MSELFDIQTVDDVACIFSEGTNINQYLNGVTPLLYFRERNDINNIKYLEIKDVIIS